MKIASFVLETKANKFILEKMSTVCQLVLHVHAHMLALSLFLSKLEDYPTYSNLDLWFFSQGIRDYCV